MTPVRLLGTSRAVCVLAGLALLLAAPKGFAQQFVLFDVTFSYTKEDADGTVPTHHSNRCHG